MNRRTGFLISALFLLALVTLPVPMAAQASGILSQAKALDISVFSAPLQQAALAPSAKVAARQTGWQYGPPSPFQYQRFDSAFVPGPEGEPWANKIYFLGGRISAPAELPDIWVFDPVTGIYADTQADMIEDVSNYNANVIMDDGTGRGPAIYVVGGYDKDYGSGGGNLGLVQRYYPQYNIIEALPPADNWPGQVAGITVGGMGSAVVNDIIYVFGGWESSVAPYFYNGTWTFDPRQPSGSRWTNLSITLNPARSYIQSAVQGGRIYAMGGTYQYVGGDLVPTNVVQVLDTANLAAGWTTLSPLQIATAEGRGFGFDDDTLSLNAPWQGFLFIAGGGDWPDISREVMQYNIGNDTWDLSFPDLNDRRVNHAGTFVPLCTPDPNDGLPGLWVFGGRSENGCDPPYGATEFYPLPCADCIVLTAATIEGPGELWAGETGTYSVTLQPPTATLPIDLVWSNGQTGPSAMYSWAEPGLHTVVVTATNCADLAVVTDSFSVEVLCIELSGAAISGPNELLAGEAGTYSVTLQPSTATLPIDLVWSNGQTGPSAVYSWAEPGLHTVVVTATNCAGLAVVTDSFSVEVLCVELSGATISGPDELLVGQVGSYTVTLEPPTATLPIDILWSNGGVSFTTVYSWTAPGFYTILVTAANCSANAIVTATFDLTVTETAPPVHFVYLPIIVKDQ